MSKDTTAPITKAVALFRRRGGILRTADAIKLGIHPRTLYAMRDGGLVEQLSRGVYRLSDLPPLGNPDLIPVALQVPKGVVCLLSALSFHEITTPDSVVMRNSSPSHRWHLRRVVI